MPAIGDAASARPRRSVSETSLACVLEDRQDDPETGRGEDDGDEKRRADEAGCSQGETDEKRDPERNRVTEGRQPEHPAAEPL
jgi:hypothetical protein